MVLGSSLGGLVAAGCGEEPAPEAPAVRPVKILEIESAATGTPREYPGKVAAARQADMAFEVAGVVIEFPVDEGEEVAEGALLARLDARDYQGAARLEQQRGKVSIDLLDQRAEKIQLALLTGSQPNAHRSQRAVQLGPGTHEVRFRFRSRPVLWGAVISAVSALLLALLILRAPSPRFG